MTKDLRMLGGPSDVHSFLQPAFGFSNPEAARDECLSRQEVKTYDLNDPFAVLSSSSYNYLPHNDAGQWDVQTILGGSSGLYADRPIYRTLATLQKPKPQGGYHVMLLVEGCRSYSVWPRVTRKHPAWWYRLSSGSFDCATVWGQPNREKLTGGMRHNGLYINAARTGRGAIYYSRANFDNEGKPDGFTSGLVLIEFAVLDRKADKDDIVRIRLVHAGKAYSYGDSPAQTHPVAHLDENWQALAARARDKFERNCQPLPFSTRKWFDAFSTQRTRYLEQRRAGLSAATFFDGIKGMSWEDALSIVQEAWQLKAVIDTHCDSKFDESVHRSDTNSSRVGTMLARYNCSHERRTQLQKMISDFVAPMDELWSYSGD